MNRFLTPFCILVFVLVGCGGGGGGNSFKSRQDSFSVGANQDADKTFEGIGIKSNVAGTFPVGSNLTLTQTAHATQMPPEEGFALAKPALELTTSEVPQHDLIVSIDDGGRDYVAAVPTSDGWLPLRSVKSNGKINFTLPVSLGKSSGRGPGLIWNWLIGFVKDNLSDSEYAIKRLEGNTDFASPGTILCLHGIFDNYQSMATLGARALVKLGGSNVHSVAYPWRKGAKVAGEQLAELLKPYKSNVKNITFVGYSQGVLTGRYALERLGATASVKNFILINGPNLGSSLGLADAADLAFEASKFWLNASVSCSPFAIDVNDPAIKEFQPSSPFLAELNSYHNTQRGDTDYYVFGGDGDWVVNVDSALANGVTLEELTGGNVWRNVVAGATHFNVKTDVTLIDRMFDSIGLIIGNELSIVLDPPSEVNAQPDGWDHLLSVRNNSASPILLKELAFEEYAKDGLSYSTQWYDPSTPTGEFFPTHYAAWGVTLGAGETTEALNLHVSTDWERHNIDEAPENLRAKTVVFILTGTQNGRPIKAKGKLICYYGSIRPAPANTRTAPRKDDRVGTISFGKPH